MATFNNVDTFEELRDAINTSKTNGQADTINITGNITLSADLPTITEDVGLTVNGGNFTISGNNERRILFVKSGTINLNNLNLSNGRAQGGSRSAGMGGALFIYGGNVTISNATFANNQALGGSSSATSDFYGIGLRYLANPANNGARGTDGTITAPNGTDGGPGGYGGFGGSGGRGFDGDRGRAGGNGGNGGNGGFAMDGGGGYFAGEGGIGFNVGGGGRGGTGGNGGFGAAGGKGGQGGNGGNVVFPRPYDSDAPTPGGAGGNGGAGGFGGGGGVGGKGGNVGRDNGFPATPKGNGGNGGGGGYGGGGGKGGTPNPDVDVFGAALELQGFTGAGGQGGFGGGNASPSVQYEGTGPATRSGGGAGMGGAIFIRSGSLTLSSVAFNSNSTTGGTGYENGKGYGGAIFAMKSTTNTNGNNQGMPTVLPTISLAQVSFSGNNAGDANGKVTTGAIGSGIDYNNDDLYGKTFSEKALAIAADASATAAEGNSGTKAFTFTVTRTGDKTGTSSANWAVTGSGANPANAADFGGTLPSGTVSFAANETSKTITVNVSGDTVVEPNENFTVTLSNPSGASITTSTATGTIQNDDTGLAIAADASATATEGNSGTKAFTFTVTRTGGTSSTSSATWAVTGSGGNPADGTDFGGTLPSGTVNFTANETSKTITVNVSGDTVVEPNENFTVTLSNPSGASITTSTATGTIQNDDTGLAIAATNAIQTEGNSGTKAFTFTVTRSGDTSGATTADWEVTGTGANPVNAADFGGTFPTGTVNFAANETSKVITVNVSGDTVIEPDESFTVTLSNPSNAATIATATANGTIQNDDIELAIAATNANQTEGNSGTKAFTFTVTRSGDTSGATTADWEVTGTGANPVNAADFGGTFPTGTVNFAANETSKVITVNVSGDTVIEPDESFTVTLSNPSNAATIATATANGTIQNDDIELAIAATNAIQPEGNSGTKAFTFTVTRSGDTSGATTADWEVTGTGANPANAGDFGGILPTGTVNFAANETSKVITINVSGDTVIEPDENFTVTLSNPSNAATIATATANGTIQNDDIELAIAATNAIQTEGNSGTKAFTFTVTRSGDISGATTADWEVTGTGANPANAGDFGGMLPTGTVNFAANEISKVITINVSGDTVVEPDENFTITLSNPSNAATITTATASGTIQNDDIELAIAATNASQIEGNSGTKAFTFTVTRSGDTSGATTADWEVTGTGANPANAGDFGGTLPTGTVNFAANETSKVITINVSGDTVIEADENFTVTLSNPSGAAAITTATANGTIQNDDIELAIAATNASQPEGNSGTKAFTFTVTRSGDTSGATTADWEVTGTGANPANAGDFGGTLPTGTVNFAANETSKVITVNVSGDTVIEPDENFTVTLSNPSGAATITTATANGTIQNDDIELEIAATNAIQTEGNSGTKPFTFTVTRSGDTSVTTTANWAVTGGVTNPANAADFGGTLPTGVVSFAIGETTKEIAVNVSGDTTGELDENFTVTLSNPSTPATITTATAGGSILNDDNALVVAPANATQAEGNSGLKAFTFTINRTGATNITTDLKWAVTGSGANPANAQDFEAGILPVGKVRFLPGETSKQISVNVRGDTTVESDETFSVSISAFTSGSTPVTIGTGTIVNDDGVAPSPVAAIRSNAILGTVGNDTLLGTAGNDTLIGVDPLNGAGTGEIDRFTGGEGSDCFVLGDSNNTYYLGNGMSDYALITDFSTGDVIQTRAGSALSIGGALPSGVLGTALYLNTDLVAVVQGAIPTAASFVVGTIAN